MPLSTYPLKAKLYSWGLRRAPIEEGDDCWGAELASWRRASRVQWSTAPVQPISNAAQKARLCEAGEPLAGA